MKQKNGELDNFDDSLDEIEKLEIEEEILEEEFKDDINDIDENFNTEEQEENEEDDVDLYGDDVDIMFRFNINSHKLEGKHALKRDTIFKGKLDDHSTSSAADEYFNIQEGINVSDGLPIEVGTNYEYESKYHEDYVNKLNLSKDVYNLLSEKTELDFSSNRRKPNRQAFNDYYKMLLDSIGKDYTKSEIFVELSYYFTDNIFNMFKLLDKEYATQIIIELKQSGYLTNLNNINFI